MPKPKRTHCRRELDAVHAVLKEKLREAGPGTVQDTENALFYRGYIRYHRHRQELDLGALLAILKRLGIRTRDFFAQVATELGETPESTETADRKPQTAVDPPEASPGAPDIDALTARSVLRRVGADLSVYGDFDDD